MESDFYGRFAGNPVMYSVAYHIELGGTEQKCRLNPGMKGH